MLLVRTLFAGNLPQPLRPSIRANTRPAQSGMPRIAGNVISQLLELLDGPHEMIEAVLLPEATGTPQSAIDLPGRIVFPRVALLQHGGLVAESGQQVDVIGHHDEVGQV